MAVQGYKKYMKKTPAAKDHTLIKIFVLSFFGMLLVFTFLIKSFSPSVDVSIGDYKHDSIENDDDAAKNGIDARLAMLQDEDQSRSFTDLMKNADDLKKETKKIEQKTEENKPKEDVSAALQTPAAEPIYRVFIGNYTSAEQAKVAKDIIAETGSNLNPIVKCIGSNSYTLQVGMFKNKNSADALLYTVQQNHLPGRIVQDY